MSSPHRPTIEVSAACTCGGVRLTVHGQVVSMLLCSCLDCQRTSGAGHLAVVVVPAPSLALSGEAKSFSRPSDSGATFTRHFCPACGTPLFGRSSRAPDLRMLPVGFFAGQNSWFSPTQLIFARSRQAWDLFADHLPKHERYRDSPP